MEKLADLKNPHKTLRVTFYANPVYNGSIINSSFFSSKGSDKQTKNQRKIVNIFLTIIFNIYTPQNNWRTNAINYNIDAVCVERILKTNFAI